MDRTLLPAALRPLAGVCTLLILLAWGEHCGQAQPWPQEAPVLLPVTGSGESTGSFSLRLWQPTPVWDQPPEPVVGSWESVRLWELYEAGEPETEPSVRAESAPSAELPVAWPGTGSTAPSAAAKPAPSPAGPVFPSPPAPAAAAGPPASEPPPGDSSSSEQPKSPAPSTEPEDRPPPGQQEKAPGGEKPSHPQKPPETEKTQASTQNTAAKSAEPKSETSAKKKQAPQASAEEVPPGQAEAKLENASSSWFFWPPVLEDWDARFKAGIDGTAGNNQRFTTRLGLDVDHKDPRFVWSSQLDYVVTTSAGRQIENEAIWDGRFERLTKDTPTGWFIHSNVEYDRFTAFDVRVTLDGGLSYYFVRDDDLSFKARVAGGTSREIGVPQAEFIPEFSYGLELQWKPHKRYQLKAKTDVFSDVRDLSDFRATTRATWRVQVDSSDRVGLQFELLNRYDSTPNGKKKYDLTYSVQLVWDL